MIKILYIPAKWDYLFFNISSPERPLHLDGCDRMNCMSTSDRIGAGFRKADELHLPLLNQLLELPNLPDQSKDEEEEAQIANKINNIIKRMQ